MTKKLLIIYDTLTNENEKLDKVWAKIIKKTKSNVYIIYLFDKNI